MALTPTQVVLFVTLVAALAFAWLFASEARERCRAHLERRFLYGVPWGTLVTVAFVFAFYLFAQGGLRNWSEPLIYPFVTWSYFYPTGVLTAGIAHGSVAHLLSNMSATLVLAPIAEYAWGHFSPRDEAGGEKDEETVRSSDEGTPTGTVDDAMAGSETGRPPIRTDGAGDDADEAGAEGGETGADGSERARTAGILHRPWVRALVIFPGALLGMALLTSTFSMGPGLGFSGAVFAIAGFALVTYPLATVVGVAGGAAVSTVLTALNTPIVRAGIETGPPSPPGWAGIGFQAHMLGFLVGVLLAIGLLAVRTDRQQPRPSAGRLFGATVLFGLAQSLWLLAFPGGEDTFVLYRGAGVVLVFLLAIGITLAATGSTRPLPRVFSSASRVPSRRQVSAFWLIFLGIVLVGTVVGAFFSSEPLAPVAGVAGFVVFLFAVPALVALFPDRFRPGSGPVTRRQTVTVCLLVFTVLVAAPSLPLSLGVVDDGTVPAGEVKAGDYAVSYAENATSGQTPAVDFGDDELFSSQQSGVIVVSEDRELWTVAVREEVLAHEGNETVHVGGFGWRETITVDRHGWNVVGNDTAYVVDLELDGETTRSFASEPSTANVRLDGHELTVVPGEEISMQVTRDGETVGEVAIPPVGERVSVGPLEVRTEAVDGDVRVLVDDGDTQVQVAERERFSS
ncbi:rhomboid family intramembrane serine protease [Halobacteria archaeon AArc-curdl1]|uniref:Rhomboid family intramembrane serine protease n=1 Tax=Natronosalvus hydrolyticus TaxID=2979988 RepID=A0AAP2Z9N6_9EURY|nr:rhomboid family intramembrane serine protease [Halobacteria archaeon AArc-curdl1]